jgi:hypothetical protein
MVGGRNGTEECSQKDESGEQNRQGNRSGEEKIEQEEEEEGTEGSWMGGDPQPEERDY